MIKINLLSPNDKSSGKWEKINRIVISSAAIIIITQFVFVLLIFTSTKYLEIENDGLDKQLESLRSGTKAKEIATMRNDIKDYGNRLKCVNQIQKEHIYWTKIIDNLGKITPDEIKIKKIYVEEYKDDLKKKDKKDSSDSSDRYKIIIKGESGKKNYLEHLLKFENNLKESAFFELITEDYLEKNYISDSDFEFRVLVDKNDIVAIK